MKTRYWLIICVLCLGIGAGGLAIINWKYLPCKGGITVDILPPQDPVIKHVDGRDPLYCGKTITITGHMKGNDIFSVLAENACMTVPQDFRLTYNCPMPKWTLQLGIIGGGAYQASTKKFDTILGIEPAFIRHYKKFGIGAGAWYMQGMINKDLWAVGAKVIFQISFGRQ